jgi:putative aldouronate transport system substrate-binding protein
MKALRRSVLLALLLAAVLPFAFAGGDGEGGSSAKATEVIFRSGGPGKQKDAEEVWSVFNDELQKHLPGTTVKFEIIPYGEYADRWKLALSAGDQLDIAGRYWMQNLDVEAAKGALTPLDDLLAEYGQDIKKNLPDWALAKGITAGEIYEIPNYQIMVGMRHAIRFPEELYTKYKMRAVTDELEKQEFMTQASWDLLAPYFAMAKADDNLRKGIGTPLSWLWQKGWESVGQGGAIEFYGRPIKVINKYDTESFRAVARTMANAYEAGYIRRDVLAMDNPRVDDGKPDGTIAWVHSTWQGEEKDSAADSTRYGYPIRVVSVVKDWRVSYAHTATNLTIPSTTKNPEKAMQVMNLLQSEGGSDLYNMLTWGLEGKHYNVVSEGPGMKRIETIGYAGQGNADSPYGLHKWAIGNTQFSWLTQSDPDDYIDLWLNANGKANASQLMGWVPDPNPTKTEEAQIAAVIKEFENTLVYGALGEDWEATYEEFLAKLDAAGIDRVISEYQSQIDAWLASK